MLPFRGIEFIEASNSLICGHCVFRVYDSPEDRPVFQVRFHPDFGIEIDERQDDGKFKTTRSGAKEDDVLRLLPEKYKWTWSEFLTAMTFFGHGKECGYNEGVRESYPAAKTA